LESAPCGRKRFALFSFILKKPQPSKHFERSQDNNGMSMSPKRNSDRINKSAKKAKLMEGIQKEFTKEGWDNLKINLEIILETIESDPQGRKAFRVLISAGCNPAVLLREILHYCGGSASALKSWRKQIGYAKSQLEAISAQLAKDASVIERIAREVMHDDDDYPPYSSVFHAPDILRQIASSLKEALTEFREQTHGKTGRTKYLVYLFYHIKAATKRSHYKEIAMLVAAVRGETSSNVVLGAEAIRRTIKRHEQEKPDFFAAERTDCLNHLAQWRQRRSSESEADTQ
jgi:hypothetical protein